jgi:tetratricopeptide (TPR) repeat protein
MLQRLNEYIGREEEKDLLRHYARRIIRESRCYALYFEAGGGLGKTRLQELFPQILEEVPAIDDALAHGRLCVAGIVDFYSFESRNPNVMEQRLIAGLKRVDMIHNSSDADEWYRLPAEQVDEAFVFYYQALDAYREARDMGGREQIAHHQAMLRQAFIDSWNNLAEMHALVMCFDTLETLFSPPAPSEALVNFLDAAKSVDRILDWMRTILPQLRHTLVLLSGRPVEDNILVRELQLLGLMLDPVHVLQRFDTPRTTKLFLQAYELTIPDHEITHVLQITEGRPLLLTCYVELLRSEWAIPPGLPFREQIASRPEFEDWLIETVLNPMELARAYTHGQSTLVYSLYFLACARRGLQRSQFTELFDRFGLSYDERVIAQLAQISLVKMIGDRLFLHDEIALMIDESGKPAELGLYQSTLDYLCEVSRQQVQEVKDRTVLLGAMADNMYYELSRDVRMGYRAYSIYADWLLGQRSVNAALILSDAFWRTMQFTVRQDRTDVLPYLDKLAQVGSALTMDEILRDEQVRRVKLLRALDQNYEALALAETLHQQFAAQGLIPEDSANPTITAARDQYLYVDLALIRAIALTQAQPVGYQRHAESLLLHIVAFLQNPDALTDPLLRLRRQAFLGQAYMYLGYVLYQQQRFADAAAVEEQGRRALIHYYKESIVDLSTGQTGPAESLLNDRISGDLAQITNNMAYNMAWRGNFRRAIRLSDEVLQRFLDQVSDYQKALFCNTNALIHIRCNELSKAIKSLEEAEQAAHRAGRKRVRGLVAHARGLYERDMMRAHGVPNPAIDRHFQEAVELLANEPNVLREVLQDRARYYRDLALLYVREEQLEQAHQYQRDALASIDQALSPQEGPSMQRADLLESKATIWNHLQEYEQAAALLDEAEQMMDLPMPEYGQIVAGKIAFQRGIIALYQANNAREALRFMAIALARTYTFSERNRDQLTYEQLIAQYIKNISTDSLRAFQTVTQSDRLIISVDDLPYQKPERVAWVNAWEDSIDYINRIIDETIIATSG